MAVKKDWEKAYEDYKTGQFTYDDIAKKYKVSKACVNSWRTRHWTKLDNADVMQNGNDNADTIQGSDIDMQSDIQQEPVKLDVTRPTELLVPIVTKQLEDTNPALIYQEYSRDNLPQISDREARFVEEYIIDLDKKDAAIRAGYSVANADSLGCRVYARPDVNAHIQVALAERRKRSGMNADTAIRELGRIGRANPARVLMADGGINPDASEDDLAAVQSVKVKVTPTKDGGEIVEKETRFHDKTRALELYMKAAGMLIDRKQIDVTAKVEEMSDDDRLKRIKELQSQLAIDVSVEP
ncbi:hypothetical protein Ga0466249_002275 [Sporomusaceae bacterium BoRhaA]|uniref:terminase small subunit n=1 Tax=Pelorhabdus rhamnosifermentans TaxID=2772457 RepID=UPI001C06180C|nr:terminase small subunit [Pelorhabdus rhamnosifermentans]MBU2701161.1 hypothetical protein [Pelorhabdus rhamnosifermentans]